MNCMGFIMIDVQRLYFVKEMSETCISNPDFLYKISAYKINPPFLYMDSSIDQLSIQTDIYLESSGFIILKIYYNLAILFTRQSDSAGASQFV